MRHRAPPMIWTADMETTLVRLAGEDLTSYQIAAVLHVSRNAVIGKAHRLKVKLGVDRTPRHPKRPGETREERNHRLRQESRRASAAKKAAKAKARIVVSPPMLPEPVVVPPVQAPTRRPVRLMDAKANHCRFPLDDEPSADMRVCGAAVIEGRSWCAACAVLVFSSRAAATATEGQRISQ